MKKSILSVILITFLTGCIKDSNKDYSEITITGYDFTQTPCSGGYYGTINNKTYRLFQVVQNNILDDKTVLPKRYLIKFDYLTGSCSSENDGSIEIVVKEIKSK